MLRYQSIADMRGVIANNLHVVPPEVDLIVGIPRSGMLAASMMSLMLNVRFCDIGTYLRDGEVLKGSTRKSRQDVERPSQSKSTFFVDDSIASGKSMMEVRQLTEGLYPQSKKTYAAVYGDPRQKIDGIVTFAGLDLPRIFEWNLFHRREAQFYCVDIDGVLCRDPHESENDDGERYLDFLASSLTLARPSYKIGHLVTSRLEKYRAATEAWLKANGVEYGRLHMLDLPSAKERRAAGCHASFKASVYKEIDDAILFIESEENQAYEIFNETRKPVLCFTSQNFYQQDSFEELLKLKTRQAVSRNGILRQVYRKIKSLS